MSQDILSQLESDDPALRHQAVIALGKSQDARALPYLAEIYQNDPLLELRQLAMQAGQHIQKMQTAVDAGQTIEPVISAMDEQRAKQFSERALDSHMAGNNDKAASELGKAFELNPNLAQDTVTRNLAQAIAGLPVDQAIQLLSNPEQRGRYNYTGTQSTFSTVTKSKKRKRSGEKEASELDLGFDTAIFFILAVASVFLPFITLLLRVGGPFAAVYVGWELGEFLLQQSLPGALFTTIVILITTAAMHFTALSQGGKAGQIEFFHKLIPLYSKAMLAVAAIISGILFFFLFSMTPETLSFLSLALLIGMFYWVFVEITLIHELGLQQGIMTIAVGIGVLIVSVIIMNALNISLAFGSFGWFTS